MQTSRTRLAAVTVATLLAVGAAPARADYWDIHQLQHQAGSESSGWWRTVIPNSMCSPWTGCLVGIKSTYGPGVTGLSGDSVAITSFGATGLTQTHRWNVDVYDATQGVILTGRAFAQYDPNAYLQHHQAIIPFESYPSQSIQVRTTDFGGGTLDQCGVQILTEAHNKIAEVGPFSQQQHEIGFQMPNVDPEVWAAYQGDPYCTVSSCRSKFMSYGPYWTLPLTAVGYYIALFKLTILDSPGFNYGTTTVATIDVTAFDGSTTKVLASRALSRADFTRAEFPVAFPLKFVGAPSMSQFQFRVRFGGVGEIIQHRTKVYDPHNDACMW